MHLAFNMDSALGNIMHCAMVVSPHQSMIFLKSGKVQTNRFSAPTCIFSQSLPIEMPSAANSAKGISNNSRLYPEGMQANTITDHQIHVLCKIRIVFLCSRLIFIHSAMLLDFLNLRRNLFERHGVMNFRGARLCGYIVIPTLIGNEIERFL